MFVHLYRTTFLFARVVFRVYDKTGSELPAYSEFRKSQGNVPVVSLDYFLALEDASREKPAGFTYLAVLVIRDDLYRSLTAVVVPAKSNKTP